MSCRQSEPDLAFRLAPAAASAGSVGFGFRIVIAPRYYIRVIRNAFFLVSAQNGADRALGSRSIPGARPSRYEIGVTESPRHRSPYNYPDSNPVELLAIASGN